MLQLALWSNWSIELGRGDERRRQTNTSCVLLPQNNTPLSNPPVARCTMQITLLVVSVLCALAGSATAECPFQQSSVPLDDAQPVRHSDTAAVESVNWKVCVGTDGPLLVEIWSSAGSHCVLADDGEA